MALSPQTREAEPQATLESQQAGKPLFTEAGREPEGRTDFEAKAGQAGQALGGKESAQVLAVETLRTKLAGAGTAAEQAEAGLDNSDLQRILAENGNDPKRALLAIMNSVAVGQDIGPHELTELVQDMGANTPSPE